MDTNVKNRIEAGKPVLLFDGVCNLCNSSVQFIMDRDSMGKIKMTSLQSEEGQAILSHFKISKDLDSLIFVENGQAYDRSDAALNVVKHLDGFWSALSVFKILPRSFRNSIYKWIARSRYRWFGKEESCRMPTPADRDRFL